jgi:hypothetical protein
MVSQHTTIFLIIAPPSLLYKINLKEGVKKPLTKATHTHNTTKRRILFFVKEKTTLLKPLPGFSPLSMANLSVDH